MLPVAEILVEPPLCEDASCLAYEADLKLYLAKFNRIDSWSRPSSLWRPTASAIDLSEFKTFSDYTTLVSRLSHGNDNRAVKKAARKGYRSRNLGVEFDRYAGSIHAIHRSKLFRTGGLMWEALVPGNDAAVDRPADHLAPSCQQHWGLMWGVFAPPEHGERLVGYTSLARAGNFLRTLHVMGHKDFLHDGVMKLLFFDIMKWLLERGDPLVQGIRYFMYGAVEHGREGLFEWKRRLQFKPLLFGRMDALRGAG